MPNINQLLENSSVFSLHPITEEIAKKIVGILTRRDPFQIYAHHFFIVDVALPVKHIIDAVETAVTAAQNIYTASCSYFDASVKCFSTICTVSHKFLRELSQIVYKIPHNLFKISLYDIGNSQAEHRNNHQSLFCLPVSLIRKVLGFQDTLSSRGEFFGIDAE